MRQKVSGLDSAHLLAGGFCGKSSSIQFFADGFHRSYGDERVKASVVSNLLKETFNKWVDDEVPRLGASLAFYTVFSLAPILIIAIAVVGIIFGESTIQQKVLQTFHNLLGQQGAQAVGYLLKTAHRPKAGIIASTIGISTLLIGATAVFSELQSALNLIWKVKPIPGKTIRTLVRQRVLSAAMIMAIAFLLLVSLMVSAALSTVGAFLSGALPGGSMLWQGINFLISLGVTSAMFASIFKVLPDVRIAWRDVSVGAIITALLFTLGKHLIGLYLGNGGISSVYGVAGSLIVLMAWVYYSAQIFLIGAEFTQVYASRFGSKLEPKAGAEWTEEHSELKAA
jgi:membrane protein